MLRKLDMPTLRAAALALLWLALFLFPPASIGVSVEAAPFAAAAVSDDAAHDHDGAGEDVSGVSGHAHHAPDHSHDTPCAVAAVFASCGGSSPARMPLATSPLAAAGVPGIHRPPRTGIPA